MIRGHLTTLRGINRPFVYAHLSIPSLPAGGIVEFLVDTGADSTLLAPGDALALGIDAAELPRAGATRGVGGITQTSAVPADLTLDGSVVGVTLRILVPTRGHQRQELAGIPSLLGRDALSRFALFFEERTRRVFLLEPAEAAVLGLPD